jgi:UDP-glucose-4-epimerase GalE
MRILVTGGAGYIGSHTTALLRASGHDVYVLDNLSTGHREAVPAGALIECDLKDRGGIERALRDWAIEAVVHFAASCYVGESVTDPAKYYRNNIVGTLNLLDAMRSVGVARIVFSSTCATYGVPTRVPITEDEPQKPVNPYGFTKLAIERALDDYSHAYGLAPIALRYFNASGAAANGQLGEDHDPETHLIPLVLQTALGQRESIQVFGTDYATPDGTCIRDYIHVDDLADAHLRAIERVRPGQFQAFNVGTGRGYSVREVIELSRQVTGLPIAVREGPRRAGDPPELIAAADKARRELGWAPKHTNLKTIIESAWNWHRTNPTGYAGHLPVA